MPYFYVKVRKNIDICNFLNGYYCHFYGVRGLFQCPPFRGDGREVRWYKVAYYIRISSFSLAKSIYGDNIKMVSNTNNGSWNIDNITLTTRQIIPTCIDNIKYNPYFNKYRLYFIKYSLYLNKQSLYFIFTYIFL